MNDLNRDEFACEKIDPYEVRWARVMLIYKLLSLNLDFDEDRPEGNTQLKEQYSQWIGQNLEREDVEFNLALLILFSIQTDDYMTELRSRLAYPDEEFFKCDEESKMIV